MMKLKKIAYGIILLSILSGCGSSDDSTVEQPVEEQNPTSDIVQPEEDITPASNTGVFLDSAVINIGYRTETLEGVTNLKGEYSYLAGETVTFFIGDLEFPVTAAKGIVTPLDLAKATNTNNTTVINIIRLLQTLDQDGDPANGLTITDMAISVATQVDFSISESDFQTLPAITSLIANAGQDDSTITELVSTADAVAHFKDSLDENEIEIDLAYTVAELEGTSLFIAEDEGNGWYYETISFSNGLFTWSDSDGEIDSGAYSLLADGIISVGDSDHIKRLSFSNDLGYTNVCIEETHQEAIDCTLETDDERAFTSLAAVTKFITSQNGEAEAEEENELDLAFTAAELEGTSFYIAEDEGNGWYYETISFSDSAVYSVLSDGIISIGDDYIRRISFSNDLGYMNVCIEGTHQGAIDCTIETDDERAFTNLAAVTAFITSQNESETGSTATSLEGPWVSSCDVDDKGKYKGNFLIVTGNKFVSGERVSFTDSQCSQIMSDNYWEGNIIIGEATTLENGEAATKVDMGSDYLVYVIEGDTLYLGVKKDDDSKDGDTEANRTVVVESFGRKVDELTFLDTLQTFTDTLSPGTSSQHTFTVPEDGDYYLPNTSDVLDNNCTDDDIEYRLNDSTDDFRLRNDGPYSFTKGEILTLDVNIYSSCSTDIEYELKIKK